MFTYSSTTGKKILRTGTVPLTNKPFIFLLVVLSLFFVSVLNVLAAELGISPGSGSYSAGQTFKAVVQVIPGGDKVNAVEATLKFDTSVLSVVSVNKAGSAFSLWTTEPTFSNSGGTIKFGGGSPTPIKKTSNLVTITFKAKSAGSGSVTVSKASVLAADGRGTDVYKGSRQATYGVKVKNTEKTPSLGQGANDDTVGNSGEAIVFGDKPSIPEIGSTTFLDPDTWYSDTEGVFTWTLPFDVDTVAVMISDDPDNRPEKNKKAIFKPAIEEFKITKDNVSDGVQYVSVNFKNQVGWGTPVNRKLQIDTTPPKSFTINVDNGNTKNSFPLLRFAAEDETSGVAYYELTVADKEPVKITVDEARLGYMLKDLEDGTYTVEVTAYDKAGNKRDSSIAVLITAGWQKPVTVAEEVSFWDFLTFTNLLIIFLILTIILEAVYIWYEKKRNRLRENKLRRETKEIQDQMERIFSALRDEIYDQINAITKRKRLSAKEKEAVESLSQALEVSETLIEKEINDVNIMLK